MKYFHYITYIIIAIIIIDSFRILAAVQYLNVDYSTYISAFLLYTSIIIILNIARKEKFESDIPVNIKRLYFFWITIIVINIIRGFFVANDYWEWKFLMLTSIPFSLIPLIFFLGKNIKISQLVIKYTLFFWFPIGFLLIPLSLATTEELYPRIMIMVSIFVLFIPFVKTKWKILILIISIVSLIIAPGFRTNIIKISISYIILISYYFLGLKNNILLKISHTFLFSLPFILFFAAIYFNFNIFYEISRFQGFLTVTKTGEIQSTTDDTRTFLYAEVLTQLYYNKAFVFGESAVGYYESKVFFNEGGAIGGKRYGSEVGILNILLRYGLLGIVSYFLLLFMNSKIGLTSSNNDLAKLLGLFIATRWSLTFIEEFTQYDINFFFFWMILGLLSSEKFRNMNNKEIRNFFLLK